MSNKREAILEWVKEITANYDNVNVENFTTSFTNGLAFCAIVHHYHPTAIDYESLSEENAVENLTLAFTKAHELGIGKIMKPEDVAAGNTDQLSLMAYLTSMHKHLVKSRHSTANGREQVDIKVQGVDESAIDKLLEKRNIIKKNSSSPAGRRSGFRPYSPMTPDEYSELAAESPILEKRTMELEQKSKELEQYRLKLVEAEQLNKEFAHRLKNYQAEETKKVAQRDEEIKQLRRDRKRANDRAARIQEDMEAMEAELAEAKSEINKLKSLNQVVRQETGDSRVVELELIAQATDVDNRLLQRQLDEKIREVNELKLAKISSQGSIGLLQEQLKEARDKIAQLERSAQRDALVMTLESKVQSLTNEVLDRKEIIDEQRRKIATQIWELEDQLSEEKAARSVLEREKMRMQTAVEHAKMKAQFEQTERERVDETNRQLRQQLDEAKAMWKKSEDERLSLERNKTAKLENEARRLQYELDAMTARCVELEKTKSRLQTNLKGVKQNIQLESGEKAKHEEVRRLLERQLDDLKERIANDQISKERSVRTLTADLQEARQLVEKLETDKKRLIAENRELRTENITLADEQRSTTTALSLLEEKKRKVDVELDAARKSITRLTREKDDLEEKLRRAERDSTLSAGAASDEAHARLERLVSRMEGQLRELNNDLNTEMDLKQEALREKRALDREVKKLQREADIEKKRSIAAEEERLRLNREIQNLRKEISELDSKVRTLTREKAELMRERLMNQVK